MRSRVRIFIAEGQHSELPRKPISLEVLFSDGQLVMEMQVRESAGCRVEPDIVLDARIAASCSGEQTLEAQVGE